jgi:FixJ family two-component response regulator
MDAKTPKSTTETPEERARLLAELTPRERSIIDDVLAHHPTLTAAEAIEHCRAMGL